MSTDYFIAGKLSGTGGVGETPTSGTPSPALRSNALSSKVTSVLSSAYTDPDIRDALALLDTRGLENSPETRRQLRLNVQKDVIQSNGDVIREFGHVAEACRSVQPQLTLKLTTILSNLNALALPLPV